MSDLQGKVVDGRFRMQRRLGEGGMGEVWVARQESLDRDVALKVMKADKSEDKAYVERFKREARAISKVVHDNVVVVHDTGTCAVTGVHFIAMELLHGVTLRERMRGAMPLTTALGIGCDIVRGLDAAHRAGIVHRDVKPENVMLVDVAGHPPRVKILDFGIARQLDGGGGAAGAGGALTQTGNIMGTPGYVAPEVSFGDTPDARSDLYAVGVVLWEMIAGRMLFAGNGALALAMKHAQVVPPRLSTLRKVPGAVDDVVARLLEKRPAARPSAHEVIAALHSVSSEPASDAAAHAAHAAGDGGARTDVASVIERSMAATATGTQMQPQQQPQQQTQQPAQQRATVARNASTGAAVAAVVDPPAPAWRRAVTTEWTTLDVDDDARMMRVARTTKPMTIDDIDKAFSWIDAPPGIDPAYFTVLVDLRRAPPSRDADWEKAIAPVLARLSHYRRSAALVRTASGALHVNRVSRENHIERHLITADEHAALAFLAAAPVYCSKWYSIDVDETRKLVRIRRSAVTFDGDTWARQRAVLLSEPRGLDRSKYALLYDSRDAPATHALDDAPAPVEQTRSELERLYRKAAVLVRSHAGKLHAERIGAKDGTFRNVFTDEAEALRFLTER